MKENRFYFKQLLSGVDVGKNDISAKQMGNFIYLIGDQETKECMVVDPAYNIDDILKTVQDDDMKLVGALVTHYQRTGRFGDPWRLAWQRIGKGRHQSAQ